MDQASLAVETIFAPASIYAWAEKPLPKAEMEFMRSNGSDFSGIKSAFHPDIVVHEPTSLTYHGDWQGYEALGKLFKTMHNSWSSMNTENMLATLEGDTLFMGCTLVATARRRMSTGIF